MEVTSAELGRPHARKQSASKKKPANSLPVLSRGISPSWASIFGPRNRITRRNSDESLKEAKVHHKRNMTTDPSTEFRRASIDSLHPPSIKEPCKSPTVAVAYQEVANAIQMGNFNKSSTAVSTITHQSPNNISPQDTLVKSDSPDAISPEAFVKSPTQLEAPSNSLDENTVNNALDIASHQMSRERLPSAKVPSYSIPATFQRSADAPLAHNIHVYPEGFETKHNTYFGLIVVGCGAACFAIGAMGGSAAWASILLACGVWVLAHKTRIDREAIYHQLDRHCALKDRLSKRGETAEWLNQLVEQMWSTLDPMQLTWLVDGLEDTLTQAMPKIQSTHVQDIELGTQAPRITNIHMFPPTVQDAPDELYGEVSFDLHAYPSSTGSSTAPPHLLLHLCMGEGSLPLPVKVQLLKFSGRARFRIQTSTESSFFKGLHLSFIWLPSFDIAVSPLGLLDLMSLPMLSHYITDSISSALQRFVEPYSLTVDLQGILSNNRQQATDTVSILQIHLRSAAYLVPDTLGTTLNANVTCSIENNKVFATTRTIASQRPEWDDTMFVPVPRLALESDLDLLVQVWDSDLDQTKLLGEVRFRIRDIFELNATTVFDGEVDLGRQHMAKERGLGGTLSMTMNHFAISQRSTPKESCPAILACFTYQALAIELNQAYSDRSCLPNPYAVLYVNHEPELVTRIKFNNPAPHWNAASEHFVRNWKSTSVTVVVKSRIPDEPDPVVGVANVDMASIFMDWDGKAPLEHSQWYSLQGGQGFGRVRFGFVIKPLEMQLPPQLTGSNVGTLVIDSLSITSSHYMDTREPFYIHAQLETNASAYQATQQAFNSPHRIEWEEDQLLFPVQDRYRNTIILSLRQKSLYTGDKNVKICKLRLRDLLDSNVQSFTLALEDKLISSSLHIRVVPLSGPDENLTLTFRAGFFPGFSYAHRRHFTTNLPGLDPKAMISESNLVWSIPAEEDILSPTFSNASFASSMPRLRSIYGEEASIHEPEAELPKLSKSATLRHLIQQKVLDLTSRNRPQPRFNTIPT
ncbi:hypothetical protein DSO57_1037495 [Entomophthora muscae]|uniref:Uncharacterized protein n=1 Tax=Entomophthora muscae TaxID=34485 RepID=A0ACC2RDQ0_9FUNG|nr:hypothetical protein DSO57_1037495 [Entomophthora muscae]